MPKVSDFRDRFEAETSTNMFSEELVMTTKDLVHAYFEAVNHERWDRLGELLHEHAVYRTPGTSPRKGRDAVIDLFENRLFSAWATHYDDPVTVIVDGESAAVEIVFTGTTPAGQHVTFEAVDIFKLHEAKIGSLRSWYDVSAVRAELSGSAS